MPRLRCLGSETWASEPRFRGWQPISRRGYDLLSRRLKFAKLTEFPPKIHTLSLIRITHRPQIPGGASLRAKSLFREH
jgi:hypothetical protein